MKICISLRDSPDHNLRKGNLRSESRWERLALEASISNPEVSEIYTCGYEWPAGSSVTKKYKGKLQKHSPRDCVLLLQDWNNSVANSHGFKAVVVNIFHGPWKEQKDEISKATIRLNNNLFFIVGHSSLFAVGHLASLSTETTFAKPLPGETYSSCVKNTNHEHLGNFISMDRLFYLPLPWISRSHYQDRFNNQNLLYLWRIIFMSQLEQDASLEWAMKEMLIDPQLNLRILTGWDPKEVKDHVNGETFQVKEEINSYFWKMARFQPYAELQSRVQIRYSLDWQNVLDEFEHTKLLITHTKHWGGPSIEAAMYGVPFVGTVNIGSLADCPNYLYTPFEEEAQALFKRLMIDHTFYKEIALQYNKYATETYGFETFNQGLNNILKSRGVI